MRGQYWGHVSSPDQSELSITCHSFLRELLAALMSEGQRLGAEALWIRAYLVSRLSTNQE